MNKLFVSIVLGGLVAIMLTACEPRKTPVQKSHDRTGSPVEITVFTYPSQRALDAAFREMHNLSRNEDRESRYGFARWPEWRDVQGNTVNDGGEWTCQIHILEPEFVDDERTLTLGHEMVHCIYGSYHE